MENFTYWYFQLDQFTQLCVVSGIGVLVGLAMTLAFAALKSVVTGFVSLFHSYGSDFFRSAVLVVVLLLVYGSIVRTIAANPRVPVDITALRAPVQAHFGAHDASIPQARVDELMTAVAATGVPAETYVYDAGHAFFNDTRPAIYQPEAAALAWDRTLTFLRRTLV